MLEIRFLGQYQIKISGEPVEIASRPSRLLFAYLTLTAGTRHPREKLAGLLWPDSDEANARSNLRQALWRLRKVIGDAYLLVENTTVAFNPHAGYRLDTESLQRASDQELPQAVAVYAGELLPGYYEDWILLERERLQALFERRIQRLLDLHILQQKWPDVLHWAEHWISLGQVPEPAYRALMKAHAAQGDLAAVAAAYERCVSALELEVGVKPSAETRELFNELLEEKQTAVRGVRAVESQAEEQKAFHNLPHQPTPFIGREQELTQARQMLTGSRMLTILGPGGTGKTRLALQLASEMISEFRNGVYFVSLAPIDSAGFVVQTVAETIGFPLSSLEDPRLQLLRHLQHRQYLLVLDNFKHLLPAATLVSEFLQRAGQVHIIVTSRERLGLKEETLLRIEGLDYPSSASDPDALSYPALRLFAESAAQLRQDFVIDAADLRHVVKICHLLQGMPLAILLAAAWVDMLTPQEISAEISGSLDFLQTEWRDMPSRHQSVRAAFEPSWQRLTPSQRELFASLSIFKGGFTRQAAESVMDASLRDLASLINKSLLRRDLATGRYEVHELLRQYAREHLAQMQPLSDAVIEKHAAYFADLMQDQWRNIIGPNQKLALQTIDADLENLRKAWRYWLIQRDAQQIKKFIDCFWRIHDIRGWFNTAAELYREAAQTLAWPKESGTDEARKAVYAEILGFQAYFMTQMGYAQKAYPLVQESVAILRQLKCFQALALHLTTLQWSAAYLTDPWLVTNHELEKIEYTSGTEGQWKRAYVRIWQSRALAWSGEYTKARENIEYSLHYFESCGDILAAIWPRLELGNMAILHGSFIEARDHYRQVLTSARDNDFEWAVAKANRYLGDLAYVLQEFTEARNYLLKSIRLSDELGLIRDVVSALYDLATVEAVAGDKATAVRMLTAVREHPLSNQSRTFSVWYGDDIVHFRGLADAHLLQLKEQLPSAQYAKAEEEGRLLELDSLVRELR